MGPLNARIAAYPGVTESIAQAIEKRVGNVEEILLPEACEKARRLPVARLRERGLNDPDEAIAGAKSRNEARRHVEVRAHRAAQADLHVQKDVQ